jgi:carboxymethylenebutenolidase
MASLPLAAVLSDPMLARAAGEGLEAVSLTTASGKGARAFLGVPGRSPAPAVVLIHEWWGLNDQIKAVTAEFAQQGFLALAVDLYDGKVATTAEDANAYRTALDAGAATEALVAWVGYLRAHPGGNGKVGTVGWCFGGGWSLNASLATPVDATVIYYGSVAKTAEELAPLAGPVLGHFGTLDERINAEMVAKFEAAMKAAGKPDLTVHWYEADHAFANPSGARYDEADAQLAWARTLEFLTQHLG